MSSLTSPDWFEEPVIDACSTKVISEVQNEAKEPQIKQSYSDVVQNGKWADEEWLSPSLEQTERIIQNNPHFAKLSGRSPTPPTRPTTPLLPLPDSMRITKSAYLEARLYNEQQAERKASGKPTKPPRPLGAVRTKSSGNVIVVKDYESKIRVSKAKTALHDSLKDNEARLQGTIDQLREELKEIKEAPPDLTTSQLDPIKECDKATTLGNLNKKQVNIYRQPLLGGVSIPYSLGDLIYKFNATYNGKPERLEYNKELTAYLYHYVELTDFEEFNHNASTITKAAFEHWKEHLSRLIEPPPLFYWWDGLLITTLALARKQVSQLVRYSWNKNKTLTAGVTVGLVGARIAWLVYKREARYHPTTTKLIDQNHEDIIESNPHRTRETTLCKLYRQIRKYTIGLLD
jgi:hypothetical protein